jgi:hypothetical protein
MKAVTLVKVSIKLLDDGDEAPVGHQRINCHRAIDVKLDVGWSPSSP